jgi:1-acyl-sn-glycerol-3-phosphate acyltransferase
MRHRRKSLRSDALRLTGRITPPVVVDGMANIPASGGYVVVVNHFSRPGFNTAWTALSLAAAIPKEIAFIMSEAWAFAGNPLGFLLRPFMKFVLASINEVYGFLSMPSMAEGFSDPGSRAAAVRRVIQFGRRHPSAVIGIAPEGQDSPELGIGLAPGGGGKFILHLNRMGFQLLPVVVQERSGKLFTKFGQVFDIPLEPGLPSEGIDTYVRQIIRDRLLVLLDPTD